MVISIYNVLGQKIRTLVDEKKQNAGTHTVQWNGRDDAGTQVTSGIYIYQIQAADFTLSRKLILLR